MQTLYIVIRTRHRSALEKSASTIGNRILSNLRNKKSFCYYCDNFLFLYSYYNIVGLIYGVAYLTIVLIFVFFLYLLFSVTTILYYKRYYLNNWRYCLYLLISFFLFFTFFRIELHFISARASLVQSFVSLSIFEFRIS